MSLIDWDHSKKNHPGSLCHDFLIANIFHAHFFICFCIFFPFFFI